MSKNIKRGIVRIVLVSIYAIFVMKLVTYVMPSNIKFEPKSGIPKEFFALLYLFFFNLNVEGSLFFDRYLNKKLTWFQYPKKRLLTQVSLIFSWAVVSIIIPFTAWYYVNDESFIYPRAPVIIFAGSIIFLLVFIGISVTINFFKQSQKSLLEAEYYKQEKLKAEYRVLQNQVNPHFLFNSLNVLIAEIKHNPKTAVEFTRKLSKVYRYVLQSKNYDLISLKEELAFINSFIFLHKVRLGEALNYEVTISEGAKYLKMPPLTLQILVENAIKHNVANEENILHIHINETSENTLIISNNIQPIHGEVESTYTGLINLSKRFELLKKEGFNFGENNGKFNVTIPLIDQ